MDVHNAYSKLKQLGFVANHAAFSVDYLNKGPRYYDHLICSRRQPSLSALMALYVRLNAIASARPHPELPKLVRAIWAELEQRSCSLLPVNRYRPAPAWVAEGARSLCARTGRPAEPSPHTGIAGHSRG